MLKFGAGFVAGFVTLFVLMLVFGDYGNKTPAPAVIAQAVEASTVSPTETPIPPPTIDAGQVLAAFTNAGIQLVNIDSAPKIDPDAPLPRSFRQNSAWVDTILGDKGGQLFVCDTPEYCKAISSYFKMFSGLAGPYIYTSPSGLVVVQLNSGFTPEQAIRYQKALANF